VKWAFLHSFISVFSGMPEYVKTQLQFDEKMGDSPKCYLNRFIFHRHRAKLRWHVFRDTVYSYRVSLELLDTTISVITDLCVVKLCFLFILLSYVRMVSKNEQSMFGCRVYLHCCCNSLQFLPSNPFVICGNQ